MAGKTLTEAIALTEKKMDMSLDDIIKMNKKGASKGKKPARVPNKNRGFLNGRGPQGNNKLKQFMDSRSSIRQGVLARKRSNFQGNQFPVTTEVARKAAAFPIRNRVFNQKMSRVAVGQRSNGAGSSIRKENAAIKQRPQTLDARFANMKEQRMKFISQQKQMPSYAGHQNGQWRRTQRQQQQGRAAGATNSANGRRFYTG